MIIIQYVMKLVYLRVLTLIVTEYECFFGEIVDNVVVATFVEVEVEAVFDIRVGVVDGIVDDVVGGVVGCPVVVVVCCIRCSISLLSNFNNSRFFDVSSLSL